MSHAFQYLASERQVWTLTCSVVDMRSRRGVDVIWQDLRYGSNRLTKTPMLIVAASLTLGLGVAAKITIVSLLNTMSCRPLPVEDSDRLAER